MMSFEDVQDVLTVSTILHSHGYEDASQTPSLVAELIEWKQRAQVDAISAEVEPVLENKPSKAKRSKASEEFEATPDPSDEPDF